jgi:Alginate lyase
LKISFKAFILLFPFLLILPASSQTFQHPGVLLDRSQLDFLKAQVAAKANPYYQEFQWARSSPYGALDYHLQGPPSDNIIDCGSHSNPNHGCREEDSDASTAYLQSVLWTVTGDHRYAQNAINILNAYGHNLKGYTNSNAPLQAAWGASKWTRAAEIIRYTNAGWKPEDIQAFSHMLTTVSLPLIQNGSGANGNWELSMIEGAIGIAVFTDNRALFDHAVAMWRERVPAYFYYQPIDGDHPHPLPRTDAKTTWNGQTVFNASLNGVSQETCRDLGHTEYAIAATMNIAATAYIQGVDLFNSEKDRLAAALEFNSALELGNPIPAGLCDGTVHLSKVHATYVLGYNALHKRLAVPLPHTLDFITQDVLTNPLPVDSGHMQIFEPFTHLAGPPPSKSPRASNQWSWERRRNPSWALVLLGVA